MTRAVYTAPVGRTMVGQVVPKSFGYEAQLLLRGQVIDSVHINGKARRALTLDEAIAQIDAWHAHEIRCGHA